MQEVLSVSSINDYLKALVESDIILSSITVKGEVSNFKQYNGGHWYFTLKDDVAQISCVVFETAGRKMKYIPVDGDEIIVRGKLSVYNKRGTYNIQVFWLDKAGLGDLTKAFLELKDRLEKEGLFAPERKKQLPPHPKKIAILGALEGAAVYDIISVAQRRDPSVKIMIIPTVVQGLDAIPSIAKNIALANASDAEIIVLARGGGSLEDLWAFNEEKTARAIADSAKPIVSAVGHEVDITIADLVADLRAPTPSVAAELIIPDQEAIRRQLYELYQRLETTMAWKLDQRRTHIYNLISKLEALNPVAVLSRGFARVERAGLPVTARDLNARDIISVHFQDGSATATIETVKHDAR
jgi:exodeoxyribonuclease VII large subunit